MPNLYNLYGSGPQQYGSAYNSYRNPQTTGWMGQPIGGSNMMYPGGSSTFDEAAGGYDWGGLGADFKGGPSMEPGGNRNWSSAPDQGMANQLGWSPAALQFVMGRMGGRGGNMGLAGLFGQNGNTGIVPPGMKPMQKGPMSQGSAFQGVQSPTGNQQTGLAAMLGGQFAGMRDSDALATVGRMGGDFWKTGMGRGIMGDPSKMSQFNQLANQTSYGGAPGQVNQAAIQSMGAPDRTQIAMANWQKRMQRGVFSG